MADKNLLIASKMLNYANTVLVYSLGCTFAEFAANKPYLEACVFNLSQLGELTKYVGKEFKAAHLEIPWADLYGLRNRIVHDYDRMDMELLWDVIQQSLPKLQKDLRNILEEARP
jgi:uncharacterized protein with HEPN domain